MDNLEHDVVVLQEGVKLKLVVLAVVRLVPVNEFVTHCHIQLVEALNGLSKIGLMLLLVQDCSIINLSENLQYLFNQFKRWYNQVKVLVVVRNLVHTFEQIRENLCQIQF